MNALGFVKQTTDIFGNRPPHDSEIMNDLFARLVLDMGETLVMRTKSTNKGLGLDVDCFMEDVGKISEKHLGPVLQETRLKAIKINKLGNYGFIEDWFQTMFIEKVKQYVENHPKSCWRFYFPECKETMGVTYPAFDAIKEFLNP